MISSSGKRLILGQSRRWPRQLISPQLRGGARYDVNNSKAVELSTLWGAKLSGKQVRDASTLISRESSCDGAHVFQGTSL